jgi:hypothetical protein
MKSFSWKYITGLLLALILASGVLLYKIDQQYMWTDEVFSFHAAQMIIEKGRPLYDSGLNYARASVYHDILAESMKLFGSDELGSRVVNIPFAVGTMLITFFFVADIFRKRADRYLLAAGVALLFLTANFTVAAVRETRMYTAATFFLTATVFTFYKAFLGNTKRSYIDLFGIRYGYDLTWVALLGISSVLAYNTHAISALFGLGVLVYILIAAVVRKRPDLLIVFAGLLLAGLAAVYYRYATLDLSTVFQTVSPPWGSDTPNLLYYPVLLVRNFPGVFLVSPLILWSVYRYRRTSEIYLLTILLTFLIFISLQTAQNERYLGPILPTMLILSITSVVQVLGAIRSKSRTLLKYAGMLVVVIITVPHLYLFAKELNEIETYTPTSISIHKKFEFTSVSDYLSDQQLEDTILIADEHSAYTLYQKGFEPDSILVRDNKAIPSNEIIDGEVTDIYFNIPFLSYKEDIESFVEENSGERVVMVIRNFEDFAGIENYFMRVNEFDTPRVYKNF